MRIAIPLTGGRLSSHFGHSEEFLFVDADSATRTIGTKRVEKAPAHVHGLLPRWLKERGVNSVFASGIGTGAVKLLSADSVRVIAGIPPLEPETLVSRFLEGTLESGPSSCDHSEHRCSHP
ncbi:MAG TPA: NifB/NifX family molybdenum-iron cluster-binding protein [Terriglobales bacterium]|nr:NifB/NifX family molybdenum-iron cluster-binding protein [Terriglobales bacterium]